ncbi:MAG: MBL fold metallo-hydrolase [Promethearchaeota archaeon]|nr:MAG: MBL fold metallo-hydrolase [Candidatus Lokiarchaeota archaeon]
MKDYIIPLFKDSNIFFIQGKQKGRVPYSNSLVIGDHLIDTGISAVRLKRVKSTFSINKLLFSHWHDDHIRDNKVFSDIPFYSHIEAKRIIENIDKLLDLYDVRGSRAEEPFKVFLSDVIDVYNTKIEGTFQDKDIINIKDNIQVHIIYTPGHSIGHCVFYIPELKFAFLADIDLSTFGPWYGGKDSKIKDFKRSIDKMLELDLETVVTGHSGLFKGKKLIQEELKKYKRIFIKREKAILSHLSKTEPKQPKDLLEKNIIYKRYDFLKPFLLAMEKTMIQKHFDELKEQNKIKPRDDGFILD